MPPSDTSPQSTIRYLTRILAALAKGAGGELRIKRKLLRQVEDETSRQVLLEDLDSKKDEIVLRFGSKNSAIYPVESEQSRESLATNRSPASAPLAQPQPPLPPKSPTSPQSALPFTDEQLARAETKIRQMRNINQIRRERPPAS
jgi:hypothetical protein